MHKKIRKIYLGILLIGGLFYLLVEPLGIEIPCFYLSTTGYLCPGCGITRMFLSMLRLDFEAAFRFNPVCFCLFFFWNLVAVLCLLGRPRWLQKPRTLYWLLGITVGILLLFGLLRNIY